MKEQRFWGMKQGPYSSAGVIIRLGLAVGVVLCSVALGWFVVSRHPFAHAAGALAVTPSPTTTPPPTLPSGPVNKTWYFAEGRVGKSFREYLTIQNPATTACAVSIQYNYTMDGSTTPSIKTMSVTVAPATRLTESVNGDLNITDSSTTAASLSTIVSVNTTATPNCNGIVAERPLYFSNFSGVASGTDVLGATKLGTTFYFADVPNDVNATSYLTILNPNNVTANVQVVYPFPTSALKQTLAVPANSRGTIAPSLAGYTGHEPAIVTSDQPILVERPTYFFNVGGVSGAFDIVGVPSLATDWLFAEGYTGGSTQEYLTVANLDPNAAATANVSIILKSGTGKTATFSLTLHNNTQIVWSVNANNTFQGSTPEVSAEVQSSGAQVVVQREMFFSYKHTLPNIAIGGTDVIGQVGPAAHNVYSFAEGYSNTGYNEWLTIQNPTLNAETIYITLVNGSGQTFTEGVQVPANSRYTLDITALVQTTAFNAGVSSSANSVSMTVQTINGAPFVAERPQYWNTQGVSSFFSEGGTDVIGYTGG